MNFLDKTSSYRPKMQFAKFILFCFRVQITRVIIKNEDINIVLNII